MTILAIAIMILSYNVEADSIPLSPTFECQIDKNSNTLGMGKTITLALNSDAITILNQATGLIGKRQDQRLAELNMPARPKNLAFYGGLTLWAAPYYQETYAGNGIEDMEVVVLASKKLLPKRPNRQGQLIFLATSEEGELLESKYTCAQIKRSRRFDNNVNITEGHSYLSEKDKERFENKLSLLLRQDLPDNETGTESIEANYFCTDSNLVATYCIVDIVTEFGNTGAYSLEYNPDADFITVLKRKTDH